MTIITILLLILGGVILSTVIGTLWYSPSTPMGKIHMKYLGLDTLTPKQQLKMMEDLKPAMWKTYSLQMILSILTSSATVIIITMSVQNGVPFSMAFGFVFFNWLCFMVPVVGSNILWGNVDQSIAWKKFFSDIFANLATLVSISLLISFFI